MVLIKLNTGGVMIYKVEGDILMSKAQVIAHGVGVNDPMDKGLALQLRNKYPSLQKDLNRWCHQHDTKPGEAWLWGGQDDVRIVNLITHENRVSSDHHYDKATLGNLRHALTALAKIVAYEKLTSIALPKIGTGLGDLDWDDVWPLIEINLGALKIPVYVYTLYRPGQVATEPGV
jgi:O-acetyl-ADP-ribose deacetylase (regulator of RNase III)